MPKALFYSSTGPSFQCPLKEQVLKEWGSKARLQYEDDEAIPSEPAIRYPQTRGI
jgi:hypothetical protein